MYRGPIYTTLVSISLGLLFAVLVKDLFSARFGVLITVFLCMTLFFEFGLLVLSWLRKYLSNSE